MAISSTNLNIKNACSQLINCVRDTPLNFSIQETPYSIYITVRKTLTRNSSYIDQNADQYLSHSEEDSEIKSKTLKEENRILATKFEKSFNYSEEAYMIIKELQNEVSELKDRAFVVKHDLEKVTSENLKETKMTSVKFDHSMSFLWIENEDPHTNLPPKGILDIFIQKKGGTPFF